MVPADFQSGECIFSFNWAQHPVGHGGFHTGAARVTGQRPFTWGFDCGSTNSHHLNDYLLNGTWKVPVSVDWLFISHFDTDHANGVELLMSMTDVCNVMVPYVENTELMVELAADPAAFVLARGAGNVIFSGRHGRRQSGCCHIGCRLKSKRKDRL